MPPDLLLECSGCGREAVWDTEAMPPVGQPELGQPVLWYCETCGRDMRHRILDHYVITDKLHHDLCVATELDRPTVDRVMAAVYRHRQRASEASPLAPLDAAEEVEWAAEAAAVPVEVVEQISVAEADWMLRRGYIVETATDA
jgi:hypothetical protein